MTESDYKEYQEALSRSKNTVVSEVKLLGDRNTIISLVTLLQWIRHAVNSKEKSEIKLKINHNVVGKNFDFLLNGEVTNDMINKEEFDIN